MKNQQLHQPLEGLHEPLLPSSPSPYQYPPLLQRPLSWPMLTCGCLLIALLLCGPHIRNMYLNPNIRHMYLGPQFHNMHLDPQFHLNPASPSAPVTISAPASLSAPVRFLAVGDWGRDGLYNQSLVAAQMGVTALEIGAQFVVSTGDNFYDEGITDEAAPNFASSFTHIFSQKGLQVPWYAVLGNHDYYGNALAQLNPVLTQRDSRWNCARSRLLTLPLCSRQLRIQEQDARRMLKKGRKVAGRSREERLEGESSVDEEKSRGGMRAEGVDAECSAVLDVFMYDTTPLIHSYRHKKHRHLDWRGLNSANWTAQENSQLQELEQWLSSSTATWKIVVGHHPVYSYGHHGDSAELIKSVDPLLKKYGVDVYMNGHDHVLQHIKHPDSNVHYLTSGAGSKVSGHAPSSSTTSLQYYCGSQGFGAFEVSANELNISFIGTSGDVLHLVQLSKSNTP